MADRESYGSPGDRLGVDGRQGVLVIDEGWVADRESW